MMANLHYRKYDCMTDTDIILDLHKKVFCQSKLSLPPVHRLMIMEGIIVNDNNNSEPIAYLLYSKNKRDQSWIYLEYIGVDPKYQNNSIGKMLIELFIDNLTKNKLYSYLDVEEDAIDTLKLIRWYSKYGYKVSEEHRTSKYESVKMTRMIRTTL